MSNMSTSIQNYNPNQYVGFGIKQLSNEETIKYCLNRSNDTKFPVLNEPNPANLSFEFRMFTSGCYYIDQRTVKWSSYGTEVYPDSSFEYTHCTSQHLTEFVGGFIVVPSAINFDDVFANASFLENPTIYTTVIVIIVCYVGAGIWCFFMDKRDILKSDVHFLEDNNLNDNYYYELIVLTGNRKESGTTSNVILNNLNS